MKTVLVTRTVNQTVKVASIVKKAVKVATIQQAVVNVPVPGPQGPAGADGAAQIPEVLNGGSF